MSENPDYVNIQFRLNEDNRRQHTNRGSKNKKGSKRNFSVCFHGDGNMIKLPLSLRRTSDVNGATNKTALCVTFTVNTCLVKKEILIYFFKHLSTASHIKLEASQFFSVIKRLLPCLQASTTSTFSASSLCLTCWLWAVPFHATHVPPQHPILTKKTLIPGGFKVQIKCSDGTHTWP